MIHRLRHLLLPGLAAATLITAALPGQCQDAASAPAAQASRRTEWLGRPWELRYFFYVTERWASKKGSAQRFDQRPTANPLDRQWETIFEPVSFFQSRDRWAQPGDGLSVVVIEFERDGTVKTPNTFGGPLRGQLDRLLYMTLSAGDHATQPRFNLGKWFMGLGDASTDWAPGLCVLDNMPSPFSLTNTSYLYGPKFIIGLTRPLVGCREWAYQLYDPDRPYIDITSYIPKRVDPDGPGTYVHELIGWSSFSDRRKPVIGKHEDDWFCLHECPNGEPPGRIPDIKAWAAKNGWAAPKRPTRVPTFPDPPARAGTYPK